MTVRASTFSAALAAAVCVGWLPAATAEERVQGLTPNEWLVAMNDSFSSLVYDGTFSYYNGIDIDTVRVVRKEIEGVQRERLVHLNGPPRELVRTGEAVECIMQPDDKLLEVENSIPSGPFARSFTRRFDALSDNYSLSFHGEGRIAGRPAVRLAIQPKDENRYGYRVWLDRENQLLLRSEMVSADRDFLEVFQFTHLIFGEDVDDRAVVAHSAAGSVISNLTLDGKTKGAAPGVAPRWRADWVPAGFAMATADVHETDDKAVDTLMYSDGLAALSVFIENVPAKGARRMVTHRGPTVMVMDIVRGPDDADYLVTVVGDVPATTAQRIARSIAYLDG